jgi:hypothetical protein
MLNAINDLIAAGARSTMHAGMFSLGKKLKIIDIVVKPIFILVMDIHALRDRSFMALPDDPMLGLIELLDANHAIAVPVE